MNRVRKLTIGMLAALLVLMIPGMAFAKSYVPVKGTRYEYDENDKKWVKTNATVTAKFSKDGKVKKVEETQTGYTRVRTYSWKGNNLKKDVIKENWSWLDGDGKTQTTTINRTERFTIKNKLPVKSERSYVSNSSQEGEWKNTTTTKYTWKKNKKKGTASITGSIQGNSYSYTETIKLKKGRRVSVKDDNGSSTYTYYRSGLLKQETIRDGDVSIVYKYNKKGYITEWTETGRDDGGAYTRKNTYKWTMNKKKKCPKSVVVTQKRTGSNAFTSTFKYEFTKFKKVSKVRNCDAFGFPVWLGIETQYA